MHFGEEDCGLYRQSQGGLLRGGVSEEIEIGMGRERKKKYLRVFFLLLLLLPFVLSKEIEK